MYCKEDSVIEWLDAKRKTLIRSTELLNDISELNYTNHSIDYFITNRIISNRAGLNNITSLQLFCIIDSIDKALNENNLAKFYTPNEINNYIKYRDKISISFPLEIHCIKINNEQYIGKCDVDFLIALRNSQLINYNKNAQRTLRRVAKGDSEYYEISINKTAVKRIQEAYKNGTFISNTITLNIPQDVESDFYYDEKEHILIINSIEHFDITDGYHRYVAMCKEKDKNPNFNYDMELRLVNFSLDKTRQFIYQEDQKTKMAKSDSDSMNTTRLSNIITERLNADMRFLLKGCIDRNESLISFAEFSDDLEYIFSLKKSKITNKELMQIEKNIRDNINYLAENNDDILVNKYPRIYWFGVLYYILNNDDVLDFNTLYKEKNLSDVKITSKKKILNMLKKR